ncbi:ATP-binding protein [bacterium]
MSFSTIIGQNRAISIFDKAVASKRLAHAYIFTGPQGIGKKITAIEFAKRLNCMHIYAREHDRVHEPCDKCVTCRQISASNYHGVTLHEVETKSISINDIKNIQKKLKYKHREQGTMCIIIDDAEKMTDEAANCFLKTLEEPPQNTLIILITSSLSRMLKTIISRCQILRFRNLEDEEIISIISQTGDYSREQIKNALHLSGETIKDALTLLENNDTKDINNYLDLEEALNKKDFSSDTFNALETLSRDKEAFREWINFLISKEHNKNKNNNVLPDEYIEFLLKTKGYLNRNINPRLIWAWMSTKMS